MGNCCVAQSPPTDAYLVFVKAYSKILEAGTAVQGLWHEALTKN